MGKSKKILNDTVEKAKEICASHNVPVEVIAMADYGTVNGMAVLKQAYMMKK